MRQASVNEAAIRELMGQRRLAEAEIQCAKLRKSDPALATQLLAEIGALSQERDSLDIAGAYHRWFYDNLLWKQRTWAGVPIYKSPLDLWNYQEILNEVQPLLVIEIGAHSGGSALFFADILTAAGVPAAKVISVDIDLSRLHVRARQRKNVAFIQSRSTSDLVQKTLAAERASIEGKVFAILDGDHSKDNVLDEMRMLRNILRPGDYLIVEDGDINGHPVLPDWGEGPYEAIEAYFAEFPDDYEHDTVRELAFGWTAAPHGFLKRR